jgi:CheY-like chemotaxis protein
MNHFKILVTTTDTRLVRSLVTLLEDDCEVVAAKNGLDCIGKLRAARPDLLVLVPPLLWGSEAGVLAVMQEDPDLRGVPVLFLAESDALQATAETDDAPPGLGRLVGRLCQWVRQNRPHTRAALLNTHSLEESPAGRAYA